MRSQFQSWRQSASVIIVAKTAYSPSIIPQGFNYKLLTLKRSTKSFVLPSTYVFPGGNFSEADGSKEWLKLYEKFGFNLNVFDKLNPRENRPYCFDNGHNEIPKHISLRITAIRETFEESGILICRSFKINYKERLARWANFIAGHEILKWQERVHDDPLQFLELCSQFEVYPDVWSLKQWSNWLTPPSIPAKFDAVFFLAAFQEQPPAVADKKEIEQVEWETPSQYLSDNKKDKIMLAPPQIYEMTRLQNFLDISKLLQFATERASCGTERYVPYTVNTEDGMVFILPGDDLYPKELNLEDQDVPYMKCLPETEKQNRIHFKSTHGNHVVTKNFIPQCNHVAPLQNKI